LCRSGTRRKVLDLVAAGRPVAQVAYDLDISAQAIYAWRRQQLIDSGLPSYWWLHPEPNGEPTDLDRARQHGRL
jgi:hypothetical protein